MPTKQNRKNKFPHDGKFNSQRCWSESLKSTEPQISPQTFHHIITKLDFIDKREYPLSLEDGGQRRAGRISCTGHRRMWHTNFIFPPLTKLRNFLRGSIHSGIPGFGYDLIWEQETSFTPQFYQDEHGKSPVIGGTMYIIQLVIYLVT